MKRFLFCLMALFISLCGLPGSHLCQTAENLLAKNEPVGISSKEETSELPEVARMIDCYKAKSMDEEGGRLDNLIRQLQSSLRSIGYIIRYKGTKTTATKFKGRGYSIKTYVFDIKGFDRFRVKFITGGARSKDSTELWVVPAGASAPAASVKDRCPEA